MAAILALARHDLRLVLSDRGAVMWLFLLPVVFATFFGLVMGGGSDPSDARAKLTVIDEDGGPVAQLLIEALEGERLELMMINPDARATTADKIRTLVLPAGLSAGVLAGEQQVLRLEKEPDTSTEAALVAQARIISAISTVLGRLVEANELASQTGEKPTEMLLSMETGEDLVTVDSRFAGRATVAPSGFAQSIPGNTVMFVLLIALTFGAASISGERAGGQLRRLATTPLSRRQIIAGKITGRVVLAWMQITVLMLVGLAANRLVGIHIGDHPLVSWIVLLVYAVAVAPLGVAFGAFFTDPDRAASIGVIGTMVMAAFGGCWWPLEIVSKPLQTVALMLPTGWAMRALHNTISFGRGFEGVITPMAVLVGFAIVFSLIAARSLKID